MNIKKIQDMTWEEMRVLLEQDRTLRQKAVDAFIEEQDGYLYDDVLYGLKYRVQRGWISLDQSGDDWIAQRAEELKAIQEDYDFFREDRQRDVLRRFLEKAALFYEMDEEDQEDAIRIIMDLVWQIDTFINRIAEEYQDYDTASLADIIAECPYFEDWYVTENGTVYAPVA